ncbi:molybdenum cofactor guanylyltransferase [Hephaestia sp. CMS5P-6]|nr:molybdenum cofactor guanylyltransferase [Hephaestia mangrovi]MBY8827559.1 molybdenum cofactor guanylyltransferase [Hephaestia mangrovi]
MILGAVIAGGQSRRFGSDKAEALLDGAPLVEHAARQLRPYVGAIVLVGRDRPGWLCLHDRPRAGLGPLGGIAAATHYAATHGHDLVLTIGCDMPRIPAKLIETLVERQPAYCASAPILGCWPASLAAALDRHVEHDPKRSIRGWADRIGASPVDTPAPLTNVNTPADLARL